MSVSVHQHDEPYARARFAVGLLVAVVLGLLAMRPIYSSDTWWHLAMGRATLEAGSPIFPEPLGLGSIGNYVNNVWLCDVLFYGLHQLAGLGGANLLVAVLAALSFLACWSLAREFAGPGAGWTSLAIAALAMGSAHLRFTTRPQSFFLLLLPTALWLSRRAAAGAGRRRWVSLTALFVVVGLWAHLHGSIIIAPAVALVAALPWVFRWSRRLQRAFPVPGRRFWLLFAILAILPLTSADGLRIIDRVVGHSDSHVMAYNEEMMPLELDQWLPPSRGFFFLEILLACGLIGFFLRRRIDVGPLLLVLCGLALTVQSNRFVAAWAILAIPWVASLLRPVEREGRARIGVTLVVLSAVTIFLGWRSGAPTFEASPVFPVGGAQALAALDVRGPIFNEYSAGGYLGWKLYGKVRLITDSRSITAFDREEEYAARRALNDPRVFDRLASIHDFQAVLIPRLSPLCSALSSRSEWQAAWFAENDVVFLPAGASAPTLQALAPCAGARNVLDCRPAVAEPFLADVDGMLRLTPEEAFLGRLGALLTLQCARPPAVDRGIGYLRGPAAGEGDHPDLLWLTAMASTIRDDLDHALALVELLPEYHHAGQLLRLRLLRHFERAEEALPIAHDQVRQRLDESPAELREHLAWACEAAGDLDCAVRQALRAALAGHPEALSRLKRYDQEGKIPKSLLSLAEGALGVVSGS